MPPDRHVPVADIAVIGAGSGGLSVAAVAAQLGCRTVLVERDRMGGDCLNTGCVPSKALLAAARAVLDARAAARFGVDATPMVDWDRVQRHVQEVIAALAPADSQSRFEGLGVRVLRGEARFTGPDRIEVDGATVRARRIVVAAGSRPAVPDIPGLAGSGFVTHQELFTMPRPDPLVILGGGAIGMEMAFAHAALGCRVTLVEQGRLGGREDPELVDVVRTALRGLGVAMHEGARVVRAAPGRLFLEDGTELGGVVLVAAGRVPNLEALDLDRAGVRTTARGVATDRGLRSLTNRRVFAVGDVADPAGVGPRYLTHAASHDAGVVVRRALFRLPARIRPQLPRAIYTDPELAQVGLTEAAAVAAGLSPGTLRWRLEDNDRAQTERRTEGLVKLVLGRGNRLLGAGIVAPGAGEMIGAWTLALDRRISLSAMADLVAPYPTRAEALKRAAGSAFAPRLFAPSTRRLVRLLRLLP